MQKAQMNILGHRLDCRQNPLLSYRLTDDLYGLPLRRSISLVLGEREKERERGRTEEGGEGEGRERERERERESNASLR